MHRALPTPQAFPNTSSHLQRKVIFHSPQDLRIADWKQVDPFATAHAHHDHETVWHSALVPSSVWRAQENYSITCGYCYLFIFN